jgi:hypothetical protein
MPLQMLYLRMCSNINDTTPHSSFERDEALKYERQRYESEAI